MRRDNLGRELFDQKADSIEFAGALERQCDWISAVPDSVFKRVLPALKSWHFAPRENHAIGMAFGACCGGKRPAVLMQNSGLGLSLDVLLGTFRLFRQGLLLIVSNRGILPWEEIQHKEWGEITDRVLDAAGIPQVSFAHEGLDGLDRAARLAFEERQIIALMVQRGNLDE